MTVAVYPGTFDPLHCGHVDIIARAAKLFDRLVVGVYDRPQKALMFTGEQRAAMAREALRDLVNVDVAIYSGLTVDFVRACGATVIVRGLRVISDFELEYQMALMTRRLDPGVDMVCLMTSLEYAFLSSTIVKEIAVAGGSVDPFVPEPVAECLRQRTVSVQRGQVATSIPGRSP